MNKFKNSAFIIFISIVLFSTNALGATLQVGPGLAYNGNTQQAINNAINAATAGDTVSLAATTFTISAPINLKSSVNLQGAGIGATIIQASYLDFKTSNLIVGNHDNSLTISGFTETENLATSTMHDSGWDNNLREWNQGVSLVGCTGVTVHDVKFFGDTGDFVHASSGSSVIVYNCINDPGPGHDSVDLWSAASSGNHIYNNYFGTFENSCIKLSNTKNVEIDHNTFFTSMGSGNAGLEVMNGDCSGLNVHHNVFDQLRLSNIYHDDSDGACSGSASVNNNIWYGKTGFSIAGMTITQSGNIQESSDNSWNTAVYGYNSSGTSIGVLPIYNGTPGITLTTPTNGATIQTVNGMASFSWTYVNSTQSIIAISNSTTPICNTNVGTASSYAQAIPNGTYWWSVKSYDDAP